MHAHHLKITAAEGSECIKKMQIRDTVGVYWQKARAYRQSDSNFKLLLLAGDVVLLSAAAQGLQVNHVMQHFCVAV